MLHGVVVAAVSAAAGALTMPVLQKLWRCVKPTKEEKKKWEPFEPGVCDLLPIHKWGWWKVESGIAESFWCPKCWSNNGSNQPPYCDERGGHFHFKCCKCNYEWAMRPGDYKEEKEEKMKNRKKKL
jgi:hypothetical protein